MEVDSRSGSNPEGSGSSGSSSSRSMALDIDLNATPICSPRSERDDVTPPVAIAGEGSGGGGGGGGGDKGKGKAVLFDINAEAAAEEEDGEDCGEWVNSGMNAVRESSTANSNDVPVPCSDLLFMGSQSDLMKASSSATGIDRLGPVDIVQQRLNSCRNLKEVGPHQTIDYAACTLSFQGLSEKFLQSLREFVFNNHGVLLEDGWRVEFFYCQSRCKAIAVYCSPEGHKFESMYDVACHLGLLSNCHSLVPQHRSDGFAFLQSELHLERRRKESLVFSRTRDFQECQENLKSSLAGGLLLDLEPTGDACMLRNNLRVTQVNSRETDGCGSSHFKSEFPVQFEDFFILSAGMIDPRPSYHCSSQIWPIGYKSCWHDKITGSLFVCHISDGGDSGPVFSVQRYPCSTYPIPIASTVLYRPSLGANNNKADTAFNINGHEDINFQTIFLDHSPPHLDFNILTDAGATSGEFSLFQPRDSLQTGTNCISHAFGNRATNNRTLSDVIGEFLVEGGSSSSVWSMVSHNMVHACRDLYKQTGACKFACRHDPDGFWPSCEVHESVEALESAGALAKFCQKSGPVNVPYHIQNKDELTTSCEALAKWLDQDRFGLDMEFVQELIEQLPGVAACTGYAILNQRIDQSKAKTVGSGFLLAKRKSDVGHEKGIYNTLSVCEKPLKQAGENPLTAAFSLPGKLLSSKLPTYLIGDVLQSWESFWRFSQVLGLENPLPFEELEEEIVDCYSPTFRCSASTVDEKSQYAEETESYQEVVEVRLAFNTHSKCAGETLTKAHCLLLKVLLAELQSKLTAFADPTIENGEFKSRKRRKKEPDNLAFAKKSMLDLLPMNELTWPELARRYLLTLSSLEGNLDSVEIVNRESAKVLHCLQGDSGAFSGSPLGVAGMEADALLLAEATRQIFGSSKNLNDNITVDSNESDALCSSKTVQANDGEIPEWAHVLEPVRKLPTNVGARIRKCIYEALDKNPPEWARKILEYSISKGVYKGNASGPTKKAVLSLLADVCGENRQQKPNRKRKGKYVGTLSDVIMKQCQRVLRCAAAADEERVFCNLLGRTLINTSDNDEEGLLGFPSMVSRPLDFRTIDLRLAFGAYNGSHEAFLEDVRELWHHIRTAYADQKDLIRLAETLSQKFEDLYEKEVLNLVHKFKNHGSVESLSSEVKQEMEDVIERASAIPKAPWDEGVCKVCGVDKDDDNVLLCDKCDSGYHTYCLNPPLARIPEGNWYCPSCATGHSNTQGSSHVHLFGSQVRKKRHRGEFMHKFLESLSHLLTSMELKDYWEYSVEERVYLLKFLCDELLNTANVREHLDQCALVSADLQQKLRSLSIEWRSLKLRDEVLSEKVPKVNESVLRGSGKSAMVGIGSLLQKNDRLTEQPLARSSLSLSHSNDRVHSEDDLQQWRTNDSSKQPCWLSSNNVLEQNFTGSGSQCVHIPDADCQVNQNSVNSGVIVENHCSQMLSSSSRDKFVGQNEPPFVVHEQKYDSNGLLGARRNFDKDVELKNAIGLILPNSEDLHRHVSTGTIGTHAVDSVHSTYVDSVNLFPGHNSFTQPDANELQPPNTEENSIKNRISVLQHSISHLDSQLQKVSLRKDFLGRDSAGRLYWAFLRPGSSPWIVVDGMVSQEHKDMKAIDRVSESSLWLSYQSDNEIEELVQWLRINDPMARELIKSIMHKFNSGLKDSCEAGSFVQDTGQPSSKPVDTEITLSSGSLLTKALTALEKKYVPCESDITNIRKPSQNPEVIRKEELYRCECLELIWPSRHHCQSCHCSFSSVCELKKHNDGKCSSDAHVSDKFEQNTSLLKGRSTSRLEEGGCSDKKTLCQSVRVGHENGTGFLKLASNLASPYKLEEIGAKFATRSSNRDLVKEIGLLGSNGTPSFVVCSSPYLSDPSLKLDSSWNGEISQSDKSMGVKNQLEQQQCVQGNLVTGKGQSNNPKDASKGSMAGSLHWEAQKSEISGLMIERRDQSLHFSCTNPGNSNISVIRDSSLRPIVGRGAQILRQLKINLLDMDAALPEEALKPSKASLEKRCSWRAFVKASKSVFQMVQATIVFESMIKTEYLRNEWWYWSSLSAAARIATVSSLALRIYTLDAAIVYERNSPSPSPIDSADDSTTKSEDDGLVHTDPVCSQQRRNAKPGSKNPTLHPSDSSKQQSKSSKKRKDSGG